MRSKASPRRVVAVTRCGLRAPLTPWHPWRRPPQVSFGTIGLSVGVTLLLAGFLGYFNFVKISDNSLSALLLIYGFPISLIGAARPDCCVRLCGR